MEVRLRAVFNDDRGSCYSDKPGNVGLVLRRAVVTGLRELDAPDLDLCCHGSLNPAAAAKVMRCQKRIL